MRTCGAGSFRVYSAELGKPYFTALSARRRKNLRITVLAAILAVAASATPNGAHAHHLLTKHTLDCSPDFPCPAAIRSRMNFWISVFGTWGKNTAILHDPEEPHRVYAVVDTRHGCRSSRKKLRKERTKVKETLRVVADKLQSGETITDDYELHIAALFYPRQNPKEIRAAAENIRCQGGVRDSFIAGLSRYHGYSAMVNQVLAENHLPLDIGYLPFVESSYNPAAYSRAGAAGIWQIMPKTARALGLKLDATLDERLDPEAATRAAAKYLTRADRVLSETARKLRETDRAQINPFIITSYNYGINGMRQAILTVAPNYMEVLERYKSPSFRTAVKNFYASFLAARHLAIDAKRDWSGSIVPRGGAYQTVVLQRPASIERIKSVFGLSEEELRPLNLALTRFVWNGWRTVPAGYRLRLPPKEDRWQKERAQLARFGSQHVLSGGEHYTVRRGDTACGIARAVAVNCSELLAANGIGRNGLILPGQKLFIPRKAERKASRGALPVFSGGYVVRRGDTACSIARRFGVDCKELIRKNKLGRNALIHVGQSLSVPRAATAGGQPPGLNADNLYITRRGDSACGVAARFGVNCRELLRLNAIGGSAIIHPGQKLRIPGLVVPETNRTARQLAEAAVDTVAPAPDKTQFIAANTATAENGGENGRENSRNDGNGRNGYAGPPGEKDELDGAASEFYGEFDFDFTVAGGDQPEVDSVTRAALLNILDTLPDLGIRVSDSGGAPQYAVRVEAEETLGHFSDWLGINGSGALRRLNKLPGDRSIGIGRRLVLPIRDAEMAQRFEQRRSEYHQVLSESLKDHYDLIGVRVYTVRSGDSPWRLAKRHGFPLWLFYRLNPSLRNGELKLGQVLTLPNLKAKI